MIPFVVTARSKRNSAFPLPWVRVLALAQVLIPGPMLGLLLGLLLGHFSASPASASERRFGYTWESATLAPEARQWVLQNTSSLGRDQYYSRLDHTAEFEFALASHVTGALHLNWANTTAYQGGSLVTDFAWQGLASEVRVQLTDPAKDVLGSAFRFKAGYGTQSLSLEGGVIGDKSLGSWIFAANILGSMLWAPELQVATAIGRDMEWISQDAIFTLRLAAAYAFAPGFSAGLEFMNQEEYARVDNAWDLETATFFLGPTLTYAGKAWWTSLSLMPQLPALKSEGESSLDLQDHERFQARLLLAFNW